MIGIGIGVRTQKVGGYGLAKPVATAATGVGQTSFTANWNAYTGAVVYLLDVSTSPTFDTFIYENQEVNAPSTSYVVIGLEPNTTYYYRVRASTEALTDPDAQAFFTRVTDAGGTLSATEQDAVNTLVVQMKADGIWNKMKAIYPMVGASAAACAQNLKSSSFTGTFTVTGWSFASTGATPNGTSAYMDSGFSMVNNFTSTGNASMGCYLRTDTGVNGADMGAGGTTNGTHGILIYSSFNSSSYYADALGSSIINSGQSNTDSRGFYVVARNSGVHSQHKRGNITINDSETEAISTNLQNLNIYIGGGNPASGNTANLYSNRENAFSFIGDFINQSEINDFYTAVQAFQTTLSRQV